MPPQAILALAVVVCVMGALASNRVSVPAAMVTGLLALVFLGTVQSEAALAGFGHPAVLAIAALFVVAAGLRETGAMFAVGPALLGLPRSAAAAQLRLMLPVTLLSAFMNNTPVVALYLPLVREWAARIRVSPSKLLIPLSFSSILGGQLTLIGSASNLIVMELYLEHLAATGIPAPNPALQFWGPALLGLPAAGLGIAYLLAVAPALLPDRVRLPDPKRWVRRFTVQMEVVPGSPVAGATIEGAGLRRLPGLYLVEINRAGHVIAAPPPRTRLQEGDRLGFAGKLESVVDLQKVRGLAPVQRRDKGPVAAPTERRLAEAVVARNSPLVGRTVRDAQFRDVYNAAIVAVHREGAPIEARIGDIELEPGDTLLLETARGFADLHRDSPDFHLVSRIAGFAPPRHNRLWVAAACFALLVAGLMLAPLEPVVVCLGAAGLMVCTGCLSMKYALRSIPLQVIVPVAAALGLATALEQSGAAAALAGALLETCSNLGLGARGMLFAVILLAAGFSQVLTKNGSAALMFPIAMAVASELGTRPEPFAFSLILGCGLSFLSPVAYQTNLMVYGPGGYRFLDFPRIGAPLTLMLAVMGALLCPWVFPFHPLP